MYYKDWIEGEFNLYYYHFIWLSFLWYVICPWTHCGDLISERTLGLFLGCHGAITAVNYLIWAGHMFESYFRFTLAFYSWSLSRLLSLSHLFLTGSIWCHLTHLSVLSPSHCHLSFSPPYIWSYCSLTIHTIFVCTSWLTPTYLLFLPHPCHCHSPLSIQMAYLLICLILHVTPITHSSCFPCSCYTPLPPVSVFRIMSPVSLYRHLTH